MTESKHYLPTNDLLFKRTIANVNYPDITQGFISDLLGLEVKSISVQNPYDISWFKEILSERKLGATIVDVLVSLADNSQVVIEMQVSRQRYFLERALYYAAKHYTDYYGNTNLIRNEYSDAKFSALYPVYSISILNFTQFKDKDALRSFSLYDIKHRCLYGTKTTSEFGGLLNLTFLELNKPKQSATRRIGHWIDFFKGKPPTGDAPKYIKEAYRLTEEQDLSEEEVKMIEAIDLAEEDRKGQIAYAREEGEKRGERRGMKLGEKRGIKQGIRQGEKEKARAITAIASNLLRASMTPELVAAHTGLDLETVRQLQAKL